MECLVRILLLAAVLLPAAAAGVSSAWAQLPTPQRPAPAAPGQAGQGQTVLVPKPLTDPAARCGVFAPPSIARLYPHLRWTGACADGLAEGRGTAAFAATPGGPAQMSWRGNFRQGQFIGEASVPGSIIAISPFLAGIELMHDAPHEGRVWVRAPLASDGAPLALCSQGTAEVTFETLSAVIASDETRMRRVMQLAVLAYRKACPAPRAMRLTVFTGGYYKPTLIARAGLDAGAPAQSLHSFENTVASRADPGRASRLQEERRTEALADSRRKWQEFTRANAVQVWVTPRQLQISPDNYESRIVAFPMRFARVLAPGSVMFDDQRWGTVVVNGLPGHLMRYGALMVIAGRSQGRQPFPGATWEVATVAATGWAACQYADCGEYLGWTTEDKSFAWGGDQSRFMR